MTQKMDLTALVPAESPDSVAGVSTAMESPQTDEAMAASQMGKRAESGPSSVP